MIIMRRRNYAGKNNVLKARKLCNEVKILCKKYNMNFFFCD